MVNHTPPTGLRNSLIIAKFELHKLFLQTRGIVALIAFGLVWGLILLYPVQSASGILLQPQFKEMIDRLFGPNTLNELFDWPVAELAVFWCVALYLFPIFSIFIAADQFASDKSRGTFRFICLRASRDSLFFGRFLGQMLIQSLLILLTVLATIILAASRDPNLLLTAGNTGLGVAINLIIVIMPYTAGMAILSLYASTARQATIYATILWTLVSIGIMLLDSQLPYVGALRWVLPGSQLDAMINTQGLASFSYAPIPLLQTAVILLLGRVYLQRSAL
ncbi:ABC transporter permease subunit [Shewanella salipaludis]|uniref:ABC transporter permease subunit n=1 Tax=Shewanella salipaludis TaxID=2723052 RepID=A0A972G3G3_9GAMM|nr:ABC transporter permease subunit [Shewanella salipaludis]NMH63735.1 ABC transporter permease subunit [Shewanella salipaludis]